MKVLLSESFVKELLQSKEKIIRSIIQEDRLRIQEK